MCETHCFLGLMDSPNISPKNFIVHDLSLSGLKISGSTCPQLTYLWTTSTSIDSS